MSQQYITSVSILHCGGEEELHFIQYLEQSLASHAGQSFALEYTKFQDNQAKDVVMFNDAQKYKKEKVPMIVLISKYFFDLIWVTTHKQGILSVITSYSSKNCLHIWMDVTEEDVKRRSNALNRRDNYFRKIKAPDLTNLLKRPEMIKKIHNLISLNGDGKFNPLNNYAVDDEVDEMKRNFQIMSVGHVIPEVPAETPAQEQPRRAPKKKPDAYKHALRMATMTPEEIEAYNRDNAAHNDSSSQNTQPTSKKKKKKKKPSGNIKLLTDISDTDIEQIAMYLGKGPGANWKQLAEAFNFDAIVIKNLIDTIPLDSLHGEQFRSEQFLDMLKRERPDIEISDFVLKCKQIMRTDVPTYIKDNILS